MAKIVDLDSPEETHWVTNYLFYRERMNHFKELAEEAKEVWLGLVGDDWDVVRVHGKPVFENAKTTPNRFSVSELKKKYPEIYTELTKPVPQSSVKVLGD